MLRPANLDSAKYDFVEHRRRDIQGLRAIAVSAVVCFHAGLPLPGGFTGVDIFFVISGFVITGMLQREWQNTGSIDLRHFYVRRIKRLLPALSLLVFVVIALSALVLSPLGSIASVVAFTGIGALLICANVVISKHTGGYFDPPAMHNPLLHTWSLSVEEQFYLLFPAVFLLALHVSRKYMKPNAAPLAAVGLIGLVSFCAAIVGSLGLNLQHYVNLSAFGPLGTTLSKNMNVALGFYSPISRAWEFAAGSILALGGTSMVPLSRRGTNALAIVGCICLAAGLLVISGSASYPGVGTLLPVVGTCTLILAGTQQNQTNPIIRLLSTRPMVTLGDVSYSWYLWHWPLISFVSSATGRSETAIQIAAIFSLVPACISYHWVENPLRHRPIAGKLAAVRFAGIIVLPTLLICGLLIFSVSRGYWSSTIVDFQRTIDTDHIDLTAGCGTGFVPASDDGKCTWNAGAKGTPIYLIGDSNAGQLSEPVISAGKQVGSPVTIITSGGCPVIGKSWAFQNDAAQAKCLKFVDDILSLLGRAKRGIVIIGLSDSNWWPGISAVGPTRATESIDPKVVRPYLQQQLTSLVRRIVADHHKVVLIQTIPKFVIPGRWATLFDMGDCTTIGVLAKLCPKPVSVTVAYEETFQRYAREQIVRTARVTNSDVIDLRPFFCRNGHCSNMGPNGLILYRNAGHLTVQGSAILAGLFRERLRSLVRGGN